MIRTSAHNVRPGQFIADDGVIFDVLSTSTRLDDGMIELVIESANVSGIAMRYVWRVLPLALIVVHPAHVRVDRSRAHRVSSESCDHRGLDVGGDRLYPARCGAPGVYVSTPLRSGVLCRAHELRARLLARAVTDNRPVAVHQLIGGR